VYPQEQRSWRVGVEQVGVGRAAEAQNHKRGQQQRHAEIEIPAQECLELIRYACFFRNTSNQLYVCNGHRTLPPENPANLSLYAIMRKGPDIRNAVWRHYSDKMGKCQERRLTKGYDSDQNHRAEEKEWVCSRGNASFTEIGTGCSA
jgi:hypothetical protein